MPIQITFLFLYSFLSKLNTKNILVMDINDYVMLYYSYESKFSCDSYDKYLFCILYCEGLSVIYQSDR